MKKNELTNSYLGGGILKTKAFTLIELLAIIVILAIIAVITVPIILNVIDSAKRGSVIDSAYGYKDSINKYYITKLSEDPNFKLDGTYLVSELKGMGLTVSGNEPTDDSWVVIKDNGVYDFSLKFDDYVANYDVDTNEVSAIKNGTIELTPAAQAEQDRINNIKQIITAYIEEAKTKNSSLESETVKSVSDMTDVVIENGPVEGWVHFDIIDDGVVIKDYSLKVDNYVADYSEDIIVTKDGTLRDVPILRVVVRTIDGVGYYNTEWIGANPVYYNPETGTSCTDYSESNSNTGNTAGCLKWYAYSEKDGKVNLLLDHNTTATLAWNSSGSNTSGPSTAFLEKLQSDTSGWTNTLTRSDSYSIKVEQPRNSIYYTIDYSGYKARLITAQEVAYISGVDSWAEKTSTTDFYFDSKTSTASSTCRYDYWAQRGDASGCSYGWLYDRTSTSCAKAGCLNNSDVVIYGYWTVSPYATVDSNSAWNVNKSGNVDANGVGNSSSFGVRPVITVPKSSIFES